MNVPFPSAALSIGLLVASGASLAAPPTKAGMCTAPERAIHTCALQGGKQVAICLGPKTASYVFGKPGKPPELVLQSPKARGWLVAHGGTDADDMHYIFRTGRTTYLVSDYYVFGDPQGRESAVIVREAKKTLATLPCERLSIRHEDGVDPSTVLALISDTDAEALVGPLHD